MPRCRKARCCRALNGDIVLKPVAMPLYELKLVELALDEYEAFRLCDGEGLHQVEAGERMGVSRGTIQRLLTSARAKLALAIDGAHAIRIMAGAPHQAGDSAQDDTK